MACGCGGSNTGAAGAASGGDSPASGPLLSGFLSADAADDYGSAASDPGIAAADVGGSLAVGSAAFHSGGFWILVVLVVGTAWYLDSKKSGDS